jgi:hypothetical protein
VNLAQSGDTRFNVDLSQLQQVVVAANLSVTIAGNLVPESCDKWRVELRPQRSGELGAAMMEFPSTNLGSWIRTDAPLRYRREFGDIRPGEYSILISPLGLRTTVNLTAGERAAVTIDVPQLSVLRLWPADLSGSPIPDGSKLGVVLWKFEDDESASREAQDIAYQGNKGDSTIAVDLSLGFATPARIVDGAWEITAPAGRKIAVHFMGPKALRADPLRVVLTEGHMDEVLTFNVK